MKNVFRIKRKNKNENDGKSVLPTTAQEFVKKINGETTPPVTGLSTEERIKVLEELVKNDANKGIVGDIVKEVPIEASKVWKTSHPEIIADVAKGEVLKKILKTYEDLYKTAGFGEKNTNSYDLSKIISEKVADGELVYDSENISKILGRRMAENIKDYGSPLHVTNIMEALSTDEEKMDLPNYIKRECDKLREEMEKEGKTIRDSDVKRLMNYNPKDTTEKISEHIKFNQNGENIKEAFQTAEPKKEPEELEEPEK